MSWQSGDRRVGVTIHGVVQGVGFRPFVYGTAVRCGVSGWVANDADAVRLEVQGAPQAIAEFLLALRTQYPPQAVISSLQIQELEAEPGDGQPPRFEIRPSRLGAQPSPVLPPDLATCSECLAEIHDPGQRRWRYPFTNCTRCGPRWSIIESVPYDRPATSMKSFRLCAACLEEYRDPVDRRFHAQPIACPQCGPRLRLLLTTGHILVEAENALQQAVDGVLKGKIVAIKGLGGFQLVVDAGNESAVARLRERKRRPDKPFAVMMRTLDQVRECCHVSETEARELASPAAPILLLQRAADTQRIANAVAPGNPTLGVMLGYTPLHHQLLETVQRPIVCTSGNLAEEPMAVDDQQAVERLGNVADIILTHNRPIVRPVDDSVTRVTSSGELQLLRRARGYAPLPIDVGRRLPCILAVGAHLKNTVALSLGDRVVMSPHIGDLDNRLTFEVHRQAIGDLLRFYGVTPEIVASDLHPDFASTAVAEQLSRQWNARLVRVQHHHAHVGSCVAENQIQGPVLGFAWDGVGYGTDGAVWGGEALLCEGGGFRRVGRLRPFPLPGGDRAAREPRRSALGLLFEMEGRPAEKRCQQWFSPSELRPLLQALESGRLFPRSSSMGRLFDAVAALCGLNTQASFEGQAAMAVEFAADKEVTDAYEVPFSDGVADWSPMIAGMLGDLDRGVEVPVIAARFHNSLAEMAVQIARYVACTQVALTGGCFQNALLANRVEYRLAEAGFRVFTHKRVPPGDGGIALGQIQVAACLAEEK